MAVTLEERKKAFAAIDKDNSGIISFDEWYNHFKDLPTAGDMTEDDLFAMFCAYDKTRSKEGIDLEEYIEFMRDVYDPRPVE